MKTPIFESLIMKPNRRLDSVGDWKLAILIAVTFPMNAIVVLTDYHPAAAIPVAVFLMAVCLWRCAYLRTENTGTPSRKPTPPAP